MLEENIQNNLKEYTSEVKKVQIKPDEYEYRCKSTIKGVKILTVHLKMVNRSFIIQWLVNFLVKEKERIFMGIKFGSSTIEDEPVYKFDLVPYRKKMFIRQRFETFVLMDDINTTSKEVDQKYMIKSESQAYVSHIVDNPEFAQLCLQLEPYLEHLGIHKSNEDTDPHISTTYEFPGFSEIPLEGFFSLLYLVANQHIQNHGAVKKLIAKGQRGKSHAQRRGVAKRGGARRKSTKKSKRKKS